MSSLGESGSYQHGYDKFENLSLYNIVSGKQYTLRSREEMPKNAKDFFGNMTISDCIFSKTKGINVIILENGENYSVIPS